MNLGNKINELRRNRNITQDALASELGVTAAAVSKWENGYTLPDVLMLCALADYFAVTTDELLGRCRELRYAAIAANTPELGEKIRDLAARHNITAVGIYGDTQSAAEAVRTNDQITHLLIGQVGGETPEWKIDWGSRPISFYLSMSNSLQGVLNDLNNALQNNS